MYIYIISIEREIYIYKEGNEKNGAASGCSKQGREREQNRENRV